MVIARYTGLFVCIYAGQRRGEIDHHTAQLLRQQIDGQIAGSMPAQLVLDFGGVDFMDSSGVGLILGRAKQMQALEGRITVQKAPPAVAKMLRLARIESI